LTIIHGKVVRAFQNDFGLKVTGAVDEDTWNTLETVTNNNKQGEIIENDEAENVPNPDEQKKSVEIENNIEEKETREEPKKEAETLEETKEDVSAITKLLLNN